MSAKAKKERIRQLAALYPRLIEWSDEDKTYIGSAPPLVGQSCHGDSSAEVAAQLEEIILDLCEDILDGKIEQPAPPQKDYSGKFIVRVDPKLHKMAAIRALVQKQSLNEFVEAAISESIKTPSVPGG